MRGFTLKKIDIIQLHDGISSLIIMIDDEIIKLEEELLNYPFIKDKLSNVYSLDLSNFHFTPIDQKPLLTTFCKKCKNLFLNHLKTNKNKEIESINLKLNNIPFDISKKKQLKKELIDINVKILHVSSDLIKISKCNNNFKKIDIITNLTICIMFLTKKIPDGLKNQILMMLVNDLIEINIEPDQFARILLGISYLTSQGHSVENSLLMSMEYETTEFNKYRIENFYSDYDYDDEDPEEKYLFPFHEFDIRKTRFIYAMSKYQEILKKLISQYHAFNERAEQSMLYSGVNIPKNTNYNITHLLDEQCMSLSTISGCLIDTIKQIISYVFMGNPSLKSFNYDFDQNSKLIISHFFEARNQHMHHQEGYDDKKIFDLYENYLNYFLTNKSFSQNFIHVYSNDVLDFDSLLYLLKEICYIHIEMKDLKKLIHKNP